MEMDYTNLMLQLATMAPEQACTGFQLYKFEKQAGRESTLDLSESILNEWEALEAEAKAGFVEREQALREKAPKSKPRSRKSTSRSKNADRTSPLTESKTNVVAIAEEKQNTNEPAKETTTEPLKEGLEKQTSPAKEPSPAKSQKSQKSSKGSKQLIQVQNQEIEEIPGMTSSKRSNQSASKAKSVERNAVVPE